MIKRLAFGAIAGALAVAPLSARADGFYLNLSVNGGWSGSDFGGAVLDGHVGYEAGAFYIQGGPSWLQPDAGDTEVGFSCQDRCFCSCRRTSGCLRRSVLRQVQGC